MLRTKNFAILLAILLLGLVVLVVAVSVFEVDSVQQQACTEEAKICPDGSSVGRTGPNCEFAECPAVTIEEPSTSTEAPIPAALPSDWARYVSANMGISFKYPNKIELSEVNGVISLQHSIPYENSGPCDMIGDPDMTYPELIDFGMTLELIETPVDPFIDGEYSIGNLSGSWVYQGSEGCGETYYYFDIGDGTTLLVKYENIQALFTGVNTWDREAILSVPGVIDNEERYEIFETILKNVELIDTSLQTQVQCSSESRNVDACIEIYQPVCGLTQVECITTPCDPVPETYSNSCFACMNERVISYSEGACEIPEPEPEVIFGYIKGFSGDNLIVDQARYISDNEEAIQAAYEDGVCETRELRICAPNGFYIRNSDSSTFNYKVTDEVTVLVSTDLATCSIPSWNREISLEKLQTSIGNTRCQGDIPFHFSLVDGVIVRIQEQYIP